MMRIQVGRNHVSIYLLRPPHYFGLHHPLPISNAQESSRLPLLENNLAQPMIRIATVVLATTVLNPGLGKMYGDPSVSQYRAKTS